MRLWLLLCLFIPYCLFGDQSLGTFRVRGVVPVIFSMDVSGMTPWGSKVVSGRLELADGNTLRITDAIQLRHLMSNKPLVLQVKVVSWTAPSPLDTYAVPTAPFHVLELQVRPPYRESGELSVLSPYEAFSPVGTSAAEIMKIGTIRANGAHVGVRGGSADMDVQIVFEEGHAVVGDYTVELEITVRDQP